MNSVIHKSATRGHANHGWLDTHHTFSFGQYYDPTRVNFGALRVLNDDIVDGGKGFGRHPHDNMEIISIPLAGDLEHMDSMNNVAVIRQNDVQIMSAGTGIYHSEYNRNRDQKVNFLQIWVFPKQRNITPNYDQNTFRPEDRKNRFQLIVSPDKKDGSVLINQDAWFYLADFDAGFKSDYKFNLDGNGLYIFVLEGNASVEGIELNKRDGLGVWDTSQVTIAADTNAQLLLMEVPM